MLGQVTTASSWAFCTAWLQAQGSLPGAGAQNPGTITAEMQEAEAILDER